VRRAQPGGQLADNAPLADIPAAVTDLLFADVVPDGHADLVSCGTNGYWLLLPGDGAGHFGPWQLIPTPANSGSHQLALGDMDEDGLVDAVVHSVFPTPTISVLLNGPGGLQPATTTATSWASELVLAGDVDGDGHEDAFLQAFDTAAKAFVVQRGDGAGHLLAPQPTPLGETESGPVLSDLDLDGLLDVVASDAQPGLAVRLGAGNGSFGAPGFFGDGLSSIKRIVRVADLDGDGAPDVVTSNVELEDVETLAGRGDGTLDAPVHWHSPTGVDDIAVADLDRDGRLDLAVGGGDATVLVLPGVGGGSFGPPAFYASNSHPSPLVAQDVDEDGYAELLLGNSYIYTAPTPQRLSNRASPWVDLDHGLAASFGQPKLTAVGPGVAGLLVELSWSGAPALSQGLLFGGLSAVNLAFHGGTLVPAPQVVLAIRPEDTLSFHWPPGVPAGTQLFLQAWFLAPSGEFAASHAVVLTTP